MTEEKNEMKIEEKKEEKLENLKKLKDYQKKEEMSEQGIETEKDSKPASEEKIKEKIEDKKDKSKKVKEEKIKKYEAVAYGRSLPVSKKHSMYIGKFIKGKKIDEAIQLMEEVIEFKRAVPFKGEIPHRKEKGIMSGRYPVKASKYFINILKGLKGNVNVNGLDLDKTRISLVSASWASRPRRSGGRRAKRVNLIIKAKEFSVGGDK